MTVLHYNTVTEISFMYGVDEVEGLDLLPAVEFPSTLLTSLNEPIKFVA